MPDQVEDVRNVLPEMGAEEQADSLDEQEVAIVIEITEVIEGGRKDKLQVLRNVPKKKYILPIFQRITQIVKNKLLF